MTFRKLTAGAALIALGVAAGAQAQESTTFDLDVDAEGRASFESFNRAFDERGIFDAWDADRNGALTREEFNFGVFRTYDTDRDDYWNADETARMQDEWDAPVQAGLHGAEAEAAEDSPAN